MAKYNMDDGVVVDTDMAATFWNEETEWDGNNHVSKATGSQWEHETLYESSKGRYYVVHTSQWQGSRPYARWLTDEDAARWLLVNDHLLPDELEEVAQTVCE